LFLEAVARNKKLGTGARNWSYELEIALKASSWRLIELELETRPGGWT